MEIKVHILQRPKLPRQARGVIFVVLYPPQHLRTETDKLESTRNDPDKGQRFSARHSESIAAARVGALYGVTMVLCV